MLNKDANRVRSEKRTLSRRTFLCLGVFAFVEANILHRLLTPFSSFEQAGVPEAIEREKIRALVKRGAFLDRSGEVLAYTDDNGRRVYQEAKSYGSIIGYESPMYGREGLEFTFDNLLHRESDAGLGEGTSIVLTLDTGLQNYLVELLHAYSPGACAVVMNAKTGELYGMVSIPTFDPALIHDTYEEIREGKGYFLNKATEKYVPGSVMKLVSGAAIAEAGLGEAVYHDVGQYVVDGYPISNYAGAAFGDVTLREGIGYSVNTYISARSVEVGGKQLEQMLSRFLIGESILLDFDALQSNYNVRDDLSESYDKVKVAATAIGQGESEITPLHVTMISASIANKGLLVKPYLIKQTQNHSGSVTSVTQPEVFTQALSEEECVVVADGMKLAAHYIGLDDTLGISCKSGTAETGKEGISNIWLTCYFSLADTTYAVTIMAPDQQEDGASLKEIVILIRKYLEDYGKGWV